MPVYLSAYLFACIIFFFAYAVAAGYSEKSQGNDFIGFCGVVLAIVGFGGLMAIASGSRGGGISFGVPPIVFLLPIVGLVGAGFFTFALVRKFRGRRIIQSAILALVVIGPLGVGAANSMFERMEENRAAEFRAAMELTNLSGTFGGHEITVPVSPILSIGARCDVSDEAGARHCNASFSGANAFKYFSGFGSTTIAFSTLQLWVPDCKTYDCTYQKSWCERRADLKESPWCWSEQRVKVTLRTDTVHPTEENMRLPLLAQTDPVEGLRIRCHPTFGATRSCEAHYELKPAVRVKMSIWNIVPGSEEQSVAKSRAYVERLWTDMVTL